MQKTHLGHPHVVWLLLTLEQTNTVWDPPGPWPDLTMVTSLYMTSRTSIIRITRFDIVRGVVVGLQVTGSYLCIWAYIPFSLCLPILRWTQLLFFYGVCVIFFHCRDVKVDFEPDCWALPILTHPISLNISVQKPPWHHLDLQCSDQPDAHAAWTWLGQMIQARAELLTLVISSWTGQSSQLFGPPRSWFLHFLLCLSRAVAADRL